MVTKRRMVRGIDQRPEVQPKLYRLCVCENIFNDTPKGERPSGEIFAPK